MKATKRHRVRQQRAASALSPLGRAAWAVTLAAGATGLAHALELGEAKGDLVLGQPLRVDVPLLLSPGETTADLQVSARARPALPADAGTAWMPGPFRILFTRIGGLPALRVCHEQALQEPILELHLAVRAADGNIVRRRYDLLTDPPLAGSAVPSCEPVSAAANIAAPRRSVAQPKALPSPARPVAAHRTGPATGTLVLPGDTLSEVAQTLRGHRPIALPLMVDALYHANPDAFSGSADKLRAGSRLTMPDLGALTATGDPEAAAASTTASAVATEVTLSNASSPGWMLRLRVSERLASLPTAAEQRLVAERYGSAPTTALVAEAPSITKIEAAPEARVDAQITTPTGKPVEPPNHAAPVVAITAESADALSSQLRNLLIATAIALLALLLVLRLTRRQQPRRRPASAANKKPAPVPLAVPAEIAPLPSTVIPEPMALLPASSRPQDVAQEIGRDFYDEVATLLIGTLRQNPERRDLRFRLLDLYFTSGKRDAFVEHTRRYLESLGGTPDENWPEIVRMGQQMAPETGLYSAQPGDVARARVIPLQGARSSVRRFYESADPTALRALREHLDRAYAELRHDGEFWRELAALSRDWLLPDPGLMSAERLTQYLGGGRILFRDERRRDPDESAALVAIGQVLIARRLGYRRVVAGGMQSRHALIVAQTAQRMGLRCTMHLTDSERSHHAGALERVIGALAAIEIVPDAAFGLAGSTQLCALNDALGRRDSLYVSPPAAGPPPYPTIVVDLVAMQGRKLRATTIEALGGHADVLITHCGDGLQTLGVIEAFLDAADTRLLCMESPVPTHSTLLFPREHRLLRATGRVDYQHIAEEAARFTTQFCAEREYARLGPTGSEVFAAALRAARDLSTSQSVIAVLPSEMTAVESQMAAKSGERSIDVTRVVPLPRA